MDTLVTALISFISTNIDDVFVLMLFFSQTNHTMKIHHIIIGQYLGIGLLTILSIIASLGVSILPHEYVGLLGLVPIFLGIKAFVDYKKDSNEDIQKQDNENNEFEETPNIQSNPFTNFFKNINTSVFKVAAVTIANGGDNVGIYIPLFSRMNLFGIFTTVIIFTILIALWCFIGLKLSKYPLIQNNIEKYKHIFVPIIFIGLGIFILIESGIIKNLFNL